MNLKSKRIYISDCWGKIWDKSCLPLNWCICSRERALLSTSRRGYARQLKLSLFALVWCHIFRLIREDGFDQCNRERAGICRAQHLWLHPVCCSHHYVFLHDILRPKDLASGGHHRELPDGSLPFVLSPDLYQKLRTYTTCCCLVFYIVEQQ